MDLEKPKLTIGERITRQRIYWGFDQKELARRTGIAQGLISHYENDKRMPGIHNAIKIAKALGVTVEELFSNI